LLSCARPEMCWPSLETPLPQGPFCKTARDDDDDLGG
jgi:hypothetical protein